MALPELRVDADIRFATSPPAAFYEDAEWFRVVADRVLARGWHVVARAEDVAAKETAVPVTLLPGALDEPLLLTRDRKERLHCISNACTHRGNLVCTQPGSAKMLRCAYHGRTFRLDGELLGAPGFEESPGFPSPSDSLMRLPVAAWGPLVFAGLAPSLPFEDLVRPLRDRAAFLAMEALRPDAAVARDEEIAANWALCIEHFLDDWPAAARGGGGSVELFPAAAIFTQAAQSAAFRAWLFPSTVVDVSAEGLIATVVRPVAPTRTLVRRIGHRIGENAGAARPNSDPSIAARVQSGLRSRVRRPGHYSPRHERAVHHFHRLVAEALARN